VTASGAGRAASTLAALAAAIACGLGCGTSQRPVEVGEDVGAQGRDEPRAPARTADPEGAAVDEGSAALRPAAVLPRLSPPAPPFLEAPPGSLDLFYAGLAAARASSASDGRVLISLFGDSHTAGDRLTGRLRQVLGERFGDAGRGLVAMGKPATRHYYQTDLRYGSTGKWNAAVGGHREDAEPFGMAGLRTWTRDRRAQSWVETCGDCAGRAGRVGRFELFYWVQPGGAKLRYRVDQRKWQTVATALKGGAPHSARAVIPVPDGPHRLTVEPAGPGPLSLFGVALERERPGVIVDGLGVVGRTLPQLASWDWNVIGAQLAERAPRLVILQYGTNEADHAELELAALARRYVQVIGRVRTAVPGASILLLGPPDMAVREAGKACDDPKRAVPPYAPAVPLSPATPPDSIAAQPALDPLTGLPVDRDGGTPWSDPACRWHTPQRLLDIVAVQRKVAREQGVAFFDSLAALGGAETIDAMVAMVPPLAYKDRVHWTGIGYGRWADALLAELLDGFQAFTISAPGAPGAPAAAAPAAEGP
jgi:lysophospholipase L1-like esterase